MPRVEERLTGNDYGSLLQLPCTRQMNETLVVPTVAMVKKARCSVATQLSCREQQWFCFFFPPITTHFASVSVVNLLSATCLSTRQCICDKRCKKHCLVSINPCTIQTLLTLPKEGFSPRHCLLPDPWGVPATERD